MEQTHIAQGPVDVTVGRRPDIYLAFSDNGEHIRFWTASEGHAREWALENWETEPFFSGAQMNRTLAEIERLSAAIRKTLDENRHLADGDVCTLIALKRAIEPPNVEVTGD